MHRIILSELSPEVIARGQQLEEEQPNLDEWVVIDKGERPGAWLFKYYHLVFNPKRSFVIARKATAREFAQVNIGAFVRRSVFDSSYKRFAAIERDATTDRFSEKESPVKLSSEEELFRAECPRVAILLGQNEFLAMFCRRNAVRPEVVRERGEIEAEADRLLYQFTPQPDRNWSADLQALAMLRQRIRKFSESLQMA